MNQAKWIWYPGESEIYHHMLLSFRRQEKGCDYPCVWHVSRPETSIRFYKSFTTEQNGEFTVITHGKGMVRFNDALLPVNEPITVAAGTYDVAVEIFDYENFPAIYVASEVLITDESWTAEPYDAAPVHGVLPPTQKPTWNPDSADSSTRRRRNSVRAVWAPSTRNAHMPSPASTTA